MIWFVAGAFLLRFATLAVSIRHERALVAAGGREFGAGNSRLLAGAHVLYYVGAATEGLHRAAGFDAATLAGLALYLFGVTMLLVVIRLLGRQWTVKLILARDHVLVSHPLFRRVRHPNYYLNLLPELAGYALVLHAWLVLAVGLPTYLLILRRRIWEEERVMRDQFPSY